jgi:molybdopterin/thiamine biosynthesis adenylyltransferase
VLAGADLVLDGCDNFATRLAVSDACVAARIPLLSAAVGRFQGQVGAFAGHLPDQPCYRCYVGDAFDADDCDTCAEDGMLGAMAGWTGTFAALQAIRVLLAGTGGWAIRNGASCTCSTASSRHADAQHRQGSGLRRSGPSPWKGTGISSSPRR